MGAQKRVIKLYLNQNKLVALDYVVRTFLSLAALTSHKDLRRLQQDARASNGVAPVPDPKKSDFFSTAECRRRRIAPGLGSCSANDRPA